MEKPGRLAHDFFWYFIGAFIPMMVGIVKTTVFTRVFSADEFGRYGLVYITFLIISVLLLTWNMNVIWRYFHYFNRIKGRQFLLSNLFYLLVFQIILFVVVSIILGMLADKSNHSLIILFSIQIIVSHILNTVLTFFRVYSLTRPFNIVQILRTSVSLGLMFYLVFITNHSIEVFVQSIIYVEIPLILILVFAYRNILSFKFTRLSWPIQKLIFSYIPPSLVSNLGLILLANSDRYIINMVEGLKSTGIYNQAYNLSMMSLNALILVFIKIVTPKLVQVLEKRSNGTEIFMQNLILVFFIIILPVTFYLSIYSREIVCLFMGKEFHESYVIIPWINAGVFLSGIVYFFELRRKFENKNSIVVIYYLLAFLLNIGLNLIFIPKMGYMAAAYTTMFSYLVLFVMFLNRADLEFFKFRIVRNKVFINICILLLVQYVAHYVITACIWPGLGLFYHIVEGVLFLTAYLLFVCKNKQVVMVLKNSGGMLV